MATIHLALDSTGDAAYPLSNGYGVIVAMAGSRAGLRAQGFANPPYTGNRIATVDTETANWDNECQPGWHYLNGPVGEALPVSKVEQLRNSLYADYGQLDAWGVGLNAQATGQPVERVNTGHDFLWRMRGGLFLISTNTTDYTIDQRIACADNVRFGALDVDSVFAFYTHFSGVATDNWISWVRPADAVRLNLAQSVVIPGTVPDSINLALPDWIATEVTA